MQCVLGETDFLVRSDVPGDRHFARRDDER